MYTVLSSGSRAESWAPLDLIAQQGPHGASARGEPAPVTDAGPVLSPGWGWRGPPLLESHRWLEGAGSGWVREGRREPAWPGGMGAPYLPPPADHLPPGANCPAGQVGHPRVLGYLRLVSAGRLER